MKICIDPGHSGPVEPGACAGDYAEADLVLAIAQKLGCILLSCGHEKILTRANSIQDDELTWRAELANSEQADIFISIHCNAAESLSARGFEVYHCPGSAEGKCLAESIHKTFLSFPYTLDRGVKEAKFTVLEKTAMPAVLVELAFLSSDEDREILTSEVYQMLMALILAMGVQGFFLST